MTLHASLAVLTVGWALIVIGLVMALAAPAAGVLVLLIGGVHVLVGYGLRHRERRRAEAT
jgi:energy-converting hydrogenase Eha subunit G